MEYAYEPVQTLLDDRGDGNVQVEIREAPRSRDEGVAHAEWIRSRLEAIASQVGRPLCVMIDLGHLQHFTIDPRLPGVYRELIEHSAIIEKIAVVGDTLAMSIILGIFTHLQKDRQKVKFFLHVTDAQDWLGW